MLFSNLITKRSISTTMVLDGKRNFKKFMLYNKRGTRNFKEQQQNCPDNEIPIYKRNVRDVGFSIQNKFVSVPEMIPELIVPDLINCELKPYVSYQTTNITQSIFTSQDLFDCVYGEKIVKDFKTNKLNSDGSPVEPSFEEQLTPEEAKLRARRTGSDIF